MNTVCSLGTVAIEMIVHKKLRGEIDLRRSCNQAGSPANHNAPPSNHSKSAPPFLVKSAVAFSLQTQHLLTDYQMVNVAQCLPPGGELLFDDMSTPLKVHLMPSAY